MGARYRPMPHDLPKAYDPTAIEDHWAEYWVKENLFAQPTPAAAPAQGKDNSQIPFVILLPPPNVTGRLHMGHMLNQTEMDILTRWRRMRGSRALWLPGTDHAGIATQMMVERQLGAEGSSRQKLGREKFVERVWEWKRHYGGAILEQMKRLGVSVDWQREYFTMDERLSVAVREAFVQLYEEGLIYRGAYIVNWCPRCQTAISDLEVVYDEHKGHLWEIRYPVLSDSGTDSGEFLIVATTRPETMLGDVAVAVHPEDARYRHLHGKKLRLPLTNREIPVILDEWVSREFGTGAVKVTPAHDPNDFALGQRHHLPSINVMDETAHINSEGGVYAGLDRFVARKRIVADLEQQNLLAGIKDHIHNVGHCDRCKTVVEPRLSLQWFVKIQPLADKAIAAVKEGHIRFTPEMYAKVYLNWMENIYDWCISRQLWWGHRIPAWHCAACHKITVAREDPVKCAHCGSDQISQETDVLDTWFSSGLLPVSVFGWPNIAGSRSDFDTFYPTSVLVTGFDILFFWVARMIMLGCWFAGDVPLPDGSQRGLADSVPFKEVYIHALVRDANREKMSKTKGNVIDPIEIVRQFGTDAVRFTMASMASPGTDIAFNVARTDGYRAFANKIWNAARFIFMNLDRGAEMDIRVDRSALGAMPAVSGDAPIEARWIVNELNETAAKVNQALESYRFDDAANAVYQFFWGSFCDWYVEIVKLRLIFDQSRDTVKTHAALTTLVEVFEAALRLLSPFMPFLTEELWHAVYDGNPPAKSIALTSFPKSTDTPAEIRATGQMQGVQFLVTGIRTRRKELGVPEKFSTPVKVVRWTGTFGGSQTVEENTDIVMKLAQASALEFVSFTDRDAEGKYSPLPWSAIGPTDILVEYEKKIDIDAERERLNKEIAKTEGDVVRDERQLNNPGFTSKAPEHIVNGLKKQLDERKGLLAKLRRDLDGLGR
jgi:valyl-tRNA synthetase